jgi:hypothetical protein
MSSDSASKWKSSKSDDTVMPSNHATFEIILLHYFEFSLASLSSAILKTANTVQQKCADTEHGSFTRQLVFEFFFFTPINI